MTPLQSWLLLIAVFAILMLVMVIILMIVRVLSVVITTWQYRRAYRRLHQATRKGIK